MEPISPQTNGEYAFDPAFAELTSSPTLNDEPMIVIDRKKKVYGSAVGLGVLTCLCLIWIFLCLRSLAQQPQLTADSLMLLLLSMTATALCLIALVWIRSRWICVGVIDINGVLASTIETKHDLPWNEILGARTIYKNTQEVSKRKLRLLLLLPEHRVIEATLPIDQLESLSRLQHSVQLNPESQGQQLGTFKAAWLVVVCATVFLLGLWLDTKIIEQWNNNVLFVGNPKAILLKVGAAVAAPIGGLGGFAWGLYHIVAQPILYPPGWLNVAE